MSKILELRTKRNTLWEQTKDFLEKNRGENGLVKAEAVEQYNKMAQEVKDLGAEIERLEQQAQIDAQQSRLETIGKQNREVLDRYVATALRLKAAEAELAQLKAAAAPQAE